MAGNFLVRYERTQFAKKKKKRGRLVHDARLSPLKAKARGKRYCEQSFVLPGRFLSTLPVCHFHFVAHSSLILKNVRGDPTKTKVSETRVRDMAKFLEEPKHPQNRILLTSLPLLSLSLFLLLCRNFFGRLLAPLHSFFVFLP